MTEKQIVEGIAWVLGLQPATQGETTRLPLPPIKALHNALLDNKVVIHLHNEPALPVRPFYHKNVLPVFNPWVDPNGSFLDAKYTYQWRCWHELAHFRTQREFMISRSGHLQAGTMSLETAVKAILWEIAAVRDQHWLYGHWGQLYYSPQQNEQEFRLVVADALYRVLTGKFFTWEGAYHYPIKEEVTA